MRLSKPSPSMVVASIALFVSLGGTSVAAVSYARNAGKVDGYDAVKASSSTKKAAGKLVAANKSGPDKGRIPGKHLAGVAHPTTELNFVNTSGDFINVARRAGIRDDAAYNAVPNGTVAQLVINGSNTFLFHVEYRGRNLLVNGVVRQDGRATPTASCLVWGTVQEINP